MGLTSWLTNCLRLFQVEVARAHHHGVANNHDRCYYTGIPMTTTTVTDWQAILERLQPAGKLQLAEHSSVSCSDGWDKGPSEHVTMVCQGL